MVLRQPGCQFDELDLYVHSKRFMGKTEKPVHFAFDEKSRGITDNTKSENLTAAVFFT